eukprot:5489992-Prymnesium_polylepis.2
MSLCGEFHDRRFWPRFRQFFLKAAGVGTALVVQCVCGSKAHRGGSGTQHPGQEDVSSAARR